MFLLSLISGTEKSLYPAAKQAGQILKLYKNKGGAVYLSDGKLTRRKGPSSIQLLPPASGK